MNYPKRKQLRLPEYDYSTPGAYFVTVCTEDKSCILSRVGADALGGPQIELTYAGSVAEKYLLSTNRIPNLRLDKYVIMPNHVHMILVVEVWDGPPRASAPTDAAIPNAVGAWKRLVHRELGEEIFQRSYYEHVIRDEADYLQIWNYIDSNPGKWTEDRYWVEYNGNMNALT